MKYIIITKKIWNKNNFKKLKKNITLLNKIDNIKIKKINPKLIFFIHWSKYIPKNLYNQFVCIQFHSSNLPKGRGGSPIQNQILKKIKKTKISAFKVTSKIDSGPICFQENLTLEGSAQNILDNMESKAIKMIYKIINKKNLKFKKQSGKATYYQRRKPNDSKLNFSNIQNINDLYDFLRMLDAPTYPKAFINLKKFKFIFSNIKRNKNILFAKVEIKKSEKR